MATISRTRPSAAEPRRHKVLEAALFRRGLTMLEEERTRCADCGRAPLIGETVFTFARGQLVCELCKPLREGEPERAEIVHSCEQNLSVRRAGPADRARGDVFSAPQWTRSSSTSSSTSRARRSSPTSPTSRTTPSSATTT